MILIFVARIFAGLKISSMHEVGLYTVKNYCEFYNILLTILQLVTVKWFTLNNCQILVILSQITSVSKMTILFFSNIVFFFHLPQSVFAHQLQILHSTVINSIFFSGNCIFNPARYGIIIKKIFHTVCRMDTRIVQYF